MRGVHATNLCPLAALALSGYMQTAAPGATVAPRRVDAMAYASAAVPTAYNAAYRLDAGGLTHTDGAGSSRTVVLLGTALGPGDTALVSERWF
jgi:polysaccharide export outer membrane protein